MTAQSTDAALSVAGSSADDDAGEYTEPVAAKSEALLAPTFCYTAQINAIKAKLQGSPYYCKTWTSEGGWTTDGWNYYNNDCSSTSSYGLWFQAARNSGSSTCSFSVKRKDDNPPFNYYCSWKLGTVNSSNYVTITNDVNSCW